MRRLLLALLILGATARLAAAEPGPEVRTPPETPWLGVIVDDAVDGGVLVIAVHPAGPADRAGLRGGDVLLRVDGREISNQEGFVADLIRRSAGSALRLELLRAGAPVEREVLLGSRAELVSSFVPLAPVAPGDPFVMAELPAPPPLEAYGLRLAEVTPDLRQHFGAPPGSGVLVTRVDLDAPRAVTGLRVGDVLLAIDDEPVATASDVQAMIVSRHAGRQGGPEMTATLVRAGQRQRVAVDLPRAAAPAVATPRLETLREIALEQELRRLRSDADRLSRRIEALESALETMRERP